MVLHGFNPGIPLALFDTAHAFRCTTVTGILICRLSSPSQSLSLRLKTSTEGRLNTTAKIISFNYTSGIQFLPINSDLVEIQSSKSPFQTILNYQHAAQRYLTYRKNSCSLYQLAFCFSPGFSKQVVFIPDKVQGSVSLRYKHK